jgi:insertion element IS1 protein InsB
VDRVAAAEVEEMGSLVGKKHQPRGLGPALDHGTGKVRVPVVGRRRDEVFLQLQALLEPLGITRFFTDPWGAEARPLAPAPHVPGKRHTPQRERKHLPLRTRLKRLIRKTLGCSTSLELTPSALAYVSIDLSLASLCNPMKSRSTTPPKNLHSVIRAQELQTERCMTELGS